MRLATIKTDDGPRAAASEGEGWFATEYRDVRELAEAGAKGLDAAREAARGSAAAAIAEPQRLAPIRRPEKILGSGINYTSHADEEPNGWMPAVPFFFSKLPNAVVGPGDPIVLPRRGLQVDYEVELAVVIGRRAKDVDPRQALDHVLGYTLMNDVSSRAIQFKEEQPGDRQITLGKSLDSFAPLGPEIVLTDEIPDPSTLQVQATVNGELRQDETVARLHFSVGELISFASTLVTLEPGDVISTGTPGGIGTFRSPPLWLQPGDVVTVSEATTIGSLTNSVEAGPLYDELPEWPTPWTPEQ